MPQLFTKRATAVARVGPVLAILALAGGATASYLWARSPAAWNVGVPARQPIPFQHSLHSGTLGIDCRYCHATVERAADAGMPSTGTCLSCHAQVWAGASLLAPLRTAAALGEPIVWTSVHRLPHAYFHHGAHLAKGVACETCHGRVDLMAETVKAETLSMGWCLDCHRDPEPRMRPREAVFATGRPGAGWQPHDSALPDDVRALYREASRRLTDCSTCHR